MVLLKKESPSMNFCLFSHLQDKYTRRLGIEQKVEPNNQGTSQLVTLSSLLTGNDGVCETDDLTCQGQVFRSNRLQT